MDATGIAVVVTVNAQAAPTTHVVEFALVISGAPPMVSVKLCVAFGNTPLLAVSGQT